MTRPHWPDATIQGDGREWKSGHDRAVFYNTVLAADQPAWFTANEDVVWRKQESNPTGGDRPEPADPTAALKADMREHEAKHANDPAPTPKPAPSIVPDSKPAQSIRDAASELLQFGQKVMRLAPQSKKPYFQSKGGHDLSTITFDNLNTLQDGDGLAIRFSESGDWKDVDLDWQSAADLARAVRLHETTAAFGRASVGVGHALYNARGTASYSFVLPEGEYPRALPDHNGEPSRTVLEIRGGSDNTFTMCVPSTHPNGERLEWIGDRREPATVGADELRAHCGRHALASVATYFYPKDAPARYECRMALSAVLVASGMPAAKVTTYVQAVAKLGGDPKWSEDFAERAAERIEDGKKLMGLPSLIKILQLPEACIRTFQEWLQTAKVTQDEGPTPKPVPLANFRRADLKGTPWVVKGFALSGAVTTIAADGGTGKTQWSLEASVHFALGEQYAGYTPMRPLKINYISGEEPLDELQRRIAAIVINMVGNDPKKFDAMMKRLDGQLYTFAGKNVAIVRKEITGDKEKIVRTKYFHELLAFTKDTGIDLSFADPTIRMHEGLIENNAEMQELHNAADALATHTESGFVFVHHTNKSSRGGVDDASAARGSSVMVDASRVVIIMSNMTRTEGKLYLPADQAEDFVHYMKIGDPKQNYATQSAMKWFHKKPVELPVKLENGEPDSRMVCVPFTPDPATSVLTAPWLQEFLDQIVNGPSEGEHYTTAKTGGGTRRGNELLATYKVPVKQCNAALALLVKHHILGVTNKYSPTAKRSLEIYEVLRREPIDEADLPVGMM